MEKFDSVKLLELIKNMPEVDQRDVFSFLCAMEVINDATRHGVITIEVRDGHAGDMDAHHKIRPKYL